MYRVPPARAWWPAVGAPLERGVRQHSRCRRRALGLPARTPSLLRGGWLPWRVLRLTYIRSAGTWKPHGLTTLRHSSRPVLSHQGNLLCRNSTRFHHAGRSSRQSRSLCRESTLDRHEARAEQVVRPRVRRTHQALWTDQLGAFGFAWALKGGKRVVVLPNVRAKLAPTVGRAGPVGENVQRTAYRARVARRWGSA